MLNAGQAEPLFTCFSVVAQFLDEDDLSECYFGSCQLCHSVLHFIALTERMNLNHHCTVNQRMQLLSAGPLGERVVQRRERMLVQLTQSMSEMRHVAELAAGETAELPLDSSFDDSESNDEYSNRNSYQSQSDSQDVSEFSQDISDSETSAVDLNELSDSESIESEFSIDSQHDQSEQLAGD
jgi:hypothetical protein